MAHQQLRCLNVVSHLDPCYGGIASSIASLSHAMNENSSLDSSAFRADLAAFCAPAENIPTDAQSLNPTLLPFGRFRLLSPSQPAKDLKTAISSADVVHIHGLWQEPTAIALPMARRLGKPILISAHGMLDEWALRQRPWKKRTYWNLLERSNLASATCLRALTLAELQDYRRMRLPNPVALIPNGVDIPANSSSQPFLQRYSHLAGKQLILFLGRLHQKKGIDLLCRAWAELHVHFPDAHLVIAGPDSDGTDSFIRRLLADLNLQKAVTMTGMLGGELKWSALAAAWVFVLPSHSEGFSVAVLEALGSGTPPIISRNCNFPEVAESFAGWVIEPTVNGIRLALADALRETPDCRQMRAAHATRLVADRYSWPAVARLTARVCSWMVQGGNPPDSIVWD